MGLLADEFLSDLDYSNAERIMKLIIELKTNLGLTLIMVEHNMALAREFGNQISEIHDDGSITTVENRSDKQKFSDLWSI